MQCGLVRHRVDAKSQAAMRPFSHKVSIRETGFRLAPDLESPSLMQIAAIFDHLRGRFQHFTMNLVVLYGGMTTAERRETEKRLKTPDTAERLVLATGRYLGEAFDDASLDTLFLTMPISWRGTLAQYVGRLHREHHAKREVIVYDYVDSGVPLLARMALKRQTGYRTLGYEISM
jgi:superfamily II DNA or RNA helicase